MSSIEATNGAVQVTGMTRSRLRSLTGGVIGNLVEWYDWYTYPAFALYFSRVFFPQGDQTAALLSAAAVFAVGFLMRPVGSLVMGIYGDKYGRRAAMKLTMLIMAVGSLGIGLIPTYASIGIFAAALLVIFRMIQGLSLGGNYGSSASYLSEMATPKHRGFWVSFHYVTLLMGHLLAMSMLLALQFLLSTEELQTWGWRIPFFFGAALAIAGMFLILTIEESTSFEAVKRKGEAYKPWKMMAQHPKELLIVFGITAAGTIAYQTYATYMPKYLVNTTGFTAQQAAQITTSAVLVFTFLQVVMGWLSDIVGRRTMLLVFAAGGTLFSYPILSALEQTRDTTTAFLLIVTGLTFLAPYTSVSALFKAELFPAKIRALAVGFPFALAIAMFGGTAEFIALSLKQAGNESLYYWYITAAMAIALVIAIRMPETQKTSRIAED